jgi:hypothetical protein
MTVAVGGADKLHNLKLEGVRDNRKGLIARMYLDKRMAGFQ